MMSMITVTHDEFIADAAGILRRSETEGPIGVTGERGEVRMIVHAPRDERSTEDDCRLALEEVHESWCNGLECPICRVIGKR